MSSESSGRRDTQTDLGKLGDGLREAGNRAGNAALDEAEATAEGVKRAGADEVRQIAETAERVADDLQQQTPLLADYVRDVAHRIESMGEALRERTVGDMLSAATDYGRKQPILLFAGAAVVGFALSRFVRSGLSPSSTDAAAARETINKATGIDV